MWLVVPASTVAGVESAVRVRVRGILAGPSFGLFKVDGRKQGW